MFILPMVKPKHGIKRGCFDDSHIPQSKRIVKAVVQSLNIANVPAISFGAPQIERLVDGKQLVQHVAVVGLLVADARIRFVVAARSIFSVAVEREPDSGVPVLELEFALVRMRKRVSRKGFGEPGLGLTRAEKSSYRNG